MCIATSRFQPVKPEFVLRNNLFFQLFFSKQTHISYMHMQANTITAHCVSFFFCHSHTNKKKEAETVNSRDERLTEIEIRKNLLSRNKNV